MNLTFKEAKEIVVSLRELRTHNKEFGGALNGIAGETKGLKQLIGHPDQGADSRDSLLVKAGVALILFPDPTITDLIGGCLIAAGMIKNRSKQLTVADVFRELQETMSEMKKATRDLAH